MDTELAPQVVHNLVHQHLWTGVRTDVVDASGTSISICVGTPPEKLHPDDESITTEYLLPARTESKWTVSQWAQAFDGVKKSQNLFEEPRRLIMAMVTSDSTVVYYFINNGLTKPKRN